MSSSPVQFAVFPVAGLGTRFLPATKTIPKEMLPVVDRPLISYAVEDALRAGVRTLVFVTSRSKQALENYFDSVPELEAELRAAEKRDLLEILRETSPRGVETVFVRQHMPLGLGHAVRCAATVVKDAPFALLLPDEVMHTSKGPSAVAQLVDAAMATQSDVIGVMRVTEDETSKYGIVQPVAGTNGVFAISGMVEKPVSNPPSHHAAAGRYVFGAGFMQELEGLARGINGEVQLTDAIARKAARQRGAVCALTLQAHRFDCGDKLGFVQAVVALALERPDLGPKLRRWLETVIAEPASPSLNKAEGAL